MATTTTSDRPATADETAANEKRFEMFYEQFIATCPAREVGRFVVINIETGEHVVATTPAAAMERAKKAFGSTDWCWSKRIQAL